MLKKVEDCCGKCVCYADGETGMIQRRGRGAEEIFFVPVGQFYRFVTDDVVTLLTRVSATEFQIDSFRAA